MFGLIFRLLLKAVVPLSIVFGVMFYLSYLNGQDPMRVFDGFGQRILAQFGSAKDTITAVPETVSDSIGGDARTFYKWQDSAGAWHYGETPPGDARALKAITLRLTDNVVPAFSAPEDEVAVDAEVADAKPEEAKLPELGSPYSPEQIKELFENTQQLQETIHERQKQQNELFGVTQKP